MNLRPSLVTNAQSPELTQPGQCPLYYPAVAPQALGGLHSAPCNPRRDAAPTASPSTPRGVIPFVRVQLLRSPPRASAPPWNRLDCIQCRLQHLRIMDVGCRNDQGQGDPLTVDQQVALGARFAAIGGIGSSLIAPLGAGILWEFRQARLQSIRSACASRRNKIRCSRSQTPARCHCCKRRQPLMPQPQPISWGSISQGMPLLSTKRIPLRAARSGMRGRPPLGLGGSGGNNGWITCHSSSLTKGCLMLHHMASIPVLLGALNLFELC
jgi:hypothetical protein